ncbi:S-adenosyl-L-methionine-dependent methyltransferase [Russula earlei]|uniref:S-adenosyl-L-methionine-dependent methyltransferase n=1 Tax=Russula earlei TaxID=71964 RepID=A0ACC0TW21_9AGAM|nr:S-adenosyl-L-methionine-dependent methyltransferase [Russula earlei]
MDSTESQKRFPHTYWHGTTNQTEIERLDALHHGIKTCLDGKSFLAPLENPQTILDLGAGSGIWAIECAENFPDAQVIAVDLNRMLPRSAPSNFQFRQLDILAEPLPLEADSFDVVHVRFLIIHLPNPRSLLERIARLVKPGGWLLIEDVTVTGEIKGDAPAVRAAFGLLCKYWESNGQVPRVSVELESWLRQTGAFSEVNVHEAVAPVGNAGAGDGASAADSESRQLGSTMKKSFRDGFSAETHPGLLALGFTPELKKQCMEEWDRSEWQMEFASALYLGTKVCLMFRSPPTTTQ